MDKRTVRWIGAGLLAGILLAAIGPCTLTHKYGPYHGRVVDDGGKPIEGALVLMAFYTEMYTLGGFTSHFVGAIETTTGEDGEFHIAAYRAWRFRVPHRWDEDCHITIFKPGYGAFPNYEGIRQRYVPNFSIPSKEYVIVELPRLKTYEERWRNWSYLMKPGGVPEEKLKTLRKLLELERVNLARMRKND